ncbi:MAG: nucleotidyltransferase domain-containing protein [Nanoarchaeota archaeon]|nr:nucleotidyltransferase domain-containing protein [Nanoarchaeota archaeon]
MNKAFSYVYDFLSMVFENEILNKEISEVILFGSTAKGTHDKNSDIDIFIEIKDIHKKEIIEKHLRSIQKSFETASEKTWKLKNFTLPINFIVGRLDDPEWGGLNEEISSSGISLYSEYKKLPEKIKHYYLFNYSLSNLKRKDKMKFIRTLFGYNINKNNKDYLQKGIIEQYNGMKLASNVVLIPSGEIKNIKKLFNEYKIKYKIFDTWIRL